MSNQHSNQDNIDEGNQIEIRKQELKDLMNELMDKRETLTKDLLLHKKMLELRNEFLDILDQFLSPEGIASKPKSNQKFDRTIFSKHNVNSNIIEDIKSMIGPDKKNESSIDHLSNSVNRINEMQSIMASLLRKEKKATQVMEINIENQRKSVISLFSKIFETVSERTTNLNSVNHGKIDPVENGAFIDTQRSAVYKKKGKSRSDKSNIIMVDHQLIPKSSLFTVKQPMSLQELQGSSSMSKKRKTELV